MKSCNHQNVIGQIVKIKSVYDLKPAFQSVLRPLCGSLAAHGVTANIVTVSAVVLSAAYGGWMAWQPENHWLWIGLSGVLFVRMALNAIDGMLAREFNQKSRLGGYLNELGDVISDACLYLPFMFIKSVEPAPILLLVWLAAIIEFTGVLAIPAGNDRNYAGPFGKSDRALLFSLFGLALFFGLPAVYVSWVLWAFVALAVYTSVKRLRQGLRTPEEENARVEDNKEDKDSEKDDDR